MQSFKSSLNNILKFQGGGQEGRVIVDIDQNYVDSGFDWNVGKQTNDV